ncbi:MAG: FlgD immunoglobulin-like domain containing protein [Candidatus Eisenbacteria bacterium]
MRTRYGWMLAVPLLLGAGAAQTAVAAASHEVRVLNYEFVPDSLSIAVGDTVNWVWEQGSHTVTSGVPCTPDGMFDTALNASSPIFTYVFDENSPDRVPYFCRPHCAMGMRAVVRVERSPTGVGEGNAPSVRFAIVGAEPNPFGPSTLIRFDLPRSSLVQIDVIDASGRIVSTIASQEFAAGRQAVAWDGTGSDGARVPSGIYYVRATMDGASAAEKLVVLR